MLKYIIHRPIAVILSFLSLLIIGVILFGKIPISLLPQVQVPQIIIFNTYPNSPATTVEKNFLQPVREKLSSIEGLNSIESKAINHYGTVYLNFEYGTRMDLAYIEVNEKLDLLTNQFPKDLGRPQVIRVNTSDIPIVRLQITPRSNSNLLEVSDFALKVLRKRLEQIDGVSLVDINGQQDGIILIRPKSNLLSSLGIKEDIIFNTINSYSLDFGSLNVKNGQYRYLVKLENTVESIEQIKQIPIHTKSGLVVLLSEIAEISTEYENPSGYHLFNSGESLVMTIHKQDRSRMNNLIPKINTTVEKFKKDYPRVDFALTQDQSFLLDAGISNLKQDLIYGGILTILLLFLFLGNWASPILMSISIPLSLIITFILFYIFNISLNIISLSGLALGIGMLIDNSIVVIDSISRKRKKGLNATDSAIEGTNEVITPVISQVLTTVAVYIPLVLLSGIAGVLVFDQSIALSISLGVSLLVAFILIPLLYRLFLKSPFSDIKDDTIFYSWISKGYHKMIDHILKHKLIYVIITIAIMPLGFIFISFIPKRTLPKISQTDSQVIIDWNEPIGVGENLKRTKELIGRFDTGVLYTESDIGIKKYLLQGNRNSIQQTEIYFSYLTEEIRLQKENEIKIWIRNNYPSAIINVEEAPNAFTQLFRNSSNYLEARFRSISDQNGINELTSIQKIINNTHPGNLGSGFSMEKSLEVLYDYDKMSLYGINRDDIIKKLQIEFGNYQISEIKKFGEIIPIQISSNSGQHNLVSNQFVDSKNKISYPISEFISLYYTEEPKEVSADIGGVYKSIYWENQNINFDYLMDKVTQDAVLYDYKVDFIGRYFEDNRNLTQLWYIFFIVLFLLYIILAFQYESLIQPFLVMLTIPIGISGGMFMLWIMGGTLDVMAAIGFIVILGLIVDDPILKVETLNRLQKKYLNMGLKKDSQLLMRMIHEAGDICLKPLLMVSLTTSFALLPVLFVGGIGNDLQKPLALVIIGGLTIGTFFTTWFVPLAFWFLNKHKFNE